MTHHTLAVDPDRVLTPDQMHAALMLMGFTYHGSPVWQVALWRLDVGGGQPPITVKGSGMGFYHARQWRGGRSDLYIDGGGEPFIEKLSEAIGAMYVSDTQSKV